MYPAETLKLLAARKGRLRERIGRQREECVAVCRRISAALEKFDAWRDRLRRFGSYAPMGLALLGLWRSRPSRDDPPRESWVGRLGRWMPVVLQGMQLFRKTE